MRHASSSLVAQSLLCLALLAFAAPLSACSNIEDSWQYKTYSKNRDAVNERARVGVLAGLAIARDEGKSDTPADDAVPSELLREDGTLDPMVEQYGLDENGALRGEGEALGMLLSQFEQAAASLEEERGKPDYLFSELLK